MPRTDSFREAALHFKEHEKYTLSPEGSRSYVNFWKQETERCLHGYHAGHDWISGYNYFYLNYSPIYLINPVPDQYGNLIYNDDGSIRGNRVQDFARFWDGDQLYYNYLEEAEKAGKHGVLLKARGKGFEQPNSELIMTPNGYKTIGEIRVNDLVMNPDGNYTKVLEVYPQGEKDVYQIILHDNRKVTAGENHLWEVLNSKRKKVIVNTKFLFKSTLIYGKNKNKNTYRYKLPGIQPVNFSKKDLPINPYVLGSLIGDGCTCRYPIKFSTNDIESVHKLKELLGTKYTITKNKWDEFGYDIKSIGYKNELARKLKILKLNIKSYNKFIPEIYKYSSIEDRLELIKGLMDTDGTSSPNGTCRFTSSSERLIDDVAFILRSLGIRCKKANTNLGGKLTKFPNGYSSIVRDTWILSITTNINIFSLKRKSKNIKDRKNTYDFNSIGIKEVIKLNYKEESTCILVQNENHLYLTKDFIPTHNSYKGGSKLNRNFFLIPGSKSFALASSKEYLLKDGLLTKAWEMMDFINEHTAWRKRRQVKDTELHKKASYKATINGKPVEKGYKSEIIGVTLMNNPNRARGKRGKLLLFEEAGSFTGLLQAWQVARPSVEQGSSIFGLMVAYGTGGEEGSSFEGLQELFDNPKGYNILPVNNIWDEGMEHKQCGFFVPDYMNKEGHMDENGTSNLITAKAACTRERLIVSDNTKDRHALKRYIAEHCNVPREAMMKLTGNMFPSQDILGVLARLELDKKYEEGFYKGRMIIDSSGEIDFQEDKSLKIITQYPCREPNPDAPCIAYEMPVRNDDGSIPYGIYVAGLDPYDFDESTSGSLGSLFIINKLTNRLVFEYTARPETAKIFYEQCRRALMFYNARALYENEKKGIFDYFESQGSLYLLCEEPKLIQDILKKPGVGRKYGLKMPEQIKRYGEGLLYQWLIKDYDSEKNIKNYHKIRSIGLLKELVAYSADANCDRVMALICIMYQLEEERTIIPNTDDREKYIPMHKRDFFNRPLFKNNNNYLNNTRIIH